MSESAPDSTSLSFAEKAGYSLGDCAANFVFMSMILFQSNFYVDVLGISASAAGFVILVARLGDAFFDPLMGVLADRTHSRWGRFRPWVLFTALPWAIVMWLAYRAPDGWGAAATVGYALLTNVALMMLYSMNNMPYSALGGVITGDQNERAKLNAFRFAAATVAQFVVGGFTLPLVAKFAGPENDLRHGWSCTMGLWALLCLGMFLITFATTRERIQPEARQRSTPRQDFGDLVRNSPWLVMFVLTLVHFSILSLRGGALYNYYHSYADRAALYDWLADLGLVAVPGASGEGVLEWLGYIVHGDRADLATSNVANVANSLVNVIGTAVTIAVILLSPPLARRFGKKNIAVAGFALTTLVSAAFYLPGPTDVRAMIGLTVLGAAVYAPTIPLLWAMFADVADYSEWKNRRRATGVIFATIGFALKAGLSLGSASFLWLMSHWGYVANGVQPIEALHGIRVGSSLIVAGLFALCTLLLWLFPIDETLVRRVSEELAERRRRPT